MKYFSYLFIVTLTVLMSCSLESTDEPLSTINEQNIDLHILPDGAIEFEGEQMSIEDFKNTFENYDLSEEAIVQLKVDGNATFGKVTDIQTILREKGVLKINYKRL
ncbi:biopolymer transporter ExbD [Fodinibius sp. Rm-B-1B1-1]|uniref:biopolymer transporter ExbD n=1 Tax=Fodinibius alkaliphilus TaxID=3140241 RepID=UPI00315A431F